MINFIRLRHYEKTCKLLPAIYEDMATEKFITKMYKRILKDILWSSSVMDESKYEELFEKNTPLLVCARYDIELERHMITEEDLPEYVTLLEEQR